MAESFIDMNVVSFLHEILLSGRGTLCDLFWYGLYNNHREGSLFRRIHMMLQILNLWNHSCKNCIFHWVMTQLTMVLAILLSIRRWPINKW